MTIWCVFVRFTYGDDHIAAFATEAEARDYAFRRAEAYMKRFTDPRIERDAVNEALDDWGACSGYRSIIYVEEVELPEAMVGRL